MVKVRPKTADVLGMRLSPEEGFVLSRVDGECTMKDLVVLTGLDETRVAAIVERLAGEGAIEVEGAAPGFGSMPPQSGVGSKPPRAGASSMPPQDQLEELGPADELEVIGPVDELEEIGPVDELEEIGPVDPLAELEAFAREGQPEPERVGPTDPPPEEPPSEPEEEESPDHQTQTREYRKIYETVFRHLEKDARIAAAQSVEGAELLALCHDADPQVIHAVLTNAKSGLDHARLIAFHHHTHIGLEMIGRRTDYIGDATVQRRLLANPQLPDTVLTRIVHPKLLADVYKISINREIPERSRIKARGLLSKKFMLASSDERAALIMKTEARCLIQLVECALDARTVQILSGRSTYSLLFIQNFARWSATPPLLLKHLLKQPVVRQNMGLRKMLLKHPNVPAELKKSFT
jgi:hypothetical protein